MLDLIGLILLFAALLIRLFVFFPVRVKGSSMLPTLKNGDLLLVRRTRHYRRRDVVICHYPRRWRTKKKKWLRQNFVKRVIGLPGETIEIRDGVIYISGSLIREHYLDPARSRYPRNKPPRKLGPDEYYVLGDNRDASNDSRSVGPIRASMMVGRVFFRFSAVDNLSQRL